MTLEPERYLAVGGALFVLGALGFLTRRNLILMILSAELMLHGVSLTLVTFGRMHHNLEGQAFTIFILTVAACEAGLALSLILALYQKTKSLDVELWADLREADLPPRMLEDDRDQPPLKLPEAASYPHLPPAGLVPDSKGASPFEGGWGRAHGEPPADQHAGGSAAPRPQPPTGGGHGASGSAQAQRREAKVSQHE